MFQKPHKPLRPRRRTSISDGFTASPKLDVPASTGEFELSSEKVTAVTRVPLCVVSERPPLTERGCDEAVTTRANIWLNLCCQTKLLKNHEREEGAGSDHLA